MFHNICESWHPVLVFLVFVSFRSQCRCGDEVLPAVDVKLETVSEDVVGYMDCRTELAEVSE